MNVQIKRDDKTIPFPRRLTRTEQSEDRHVR